LPHEHPANPTSTPASPTAASPALASAVLGMTADQYADACIAAGTHGARPLALERYANLFRRGIIDSPHLPVTLPPIVRTHTSESPEGTVLKFTQSVPVTVDGTRAPRPTTLASAPGEIGSGLGLPVLQPSITSLETESVLIPMVGRKQMRSYTLCISSQVGCAMGCGFCQTAQMGLVRSLTAAEIISQYFAAAHLVTRPDPAATIANIVFMGMGEPLDNYDQVLQAVRVLTDRRGPSLAMNKITISTVGRLDGIAKLAEQVRHEGWHRLSLAISLNAPNDAVRSQIMPINRAMPMADLRRAMTDWPFYCGKHLCIEYVLIPGINDAPHHAEQLAAYYKGDDYDGPAELDGHPIPRYAGPQLRGLINIIPYNPRHNSPWLAPTEEAAEAFMDRLKARTVYCKRRRTKGRDTMAACGQLGNPEVTRKAVAASLR
jgi:23S rRNA (adenine2503-C2)-methyltransferase